MSAYLIAQINVTNKDSYKDYLSKVSSIVEKLEEEYLELKEKFNDIDGDIPIGESLKDVVERVEPYFNNFIKIIYNMTFHLVID